MLSHTLFSSHSFPYTYVHTHVHEIDAPGHHPPRLRMEIVRHGYRMLYHHLPCMQYVLHIQEKPVNKPPVKPSMHIFKPNFHKTSLALHKFRQITSPYILDPLEVDLISGSSCIISTLIRRRTVQYNNMSAQDREPRAFYFLCRGKE